MLPSMNNMSFACPNSEPVSPPPSQLMTKANGDVHLGADGDMHTNLANGQATLNCDKSKILASQNGDLSVAHETYGYRAVVDNLAISRGDDCEVYGEANGALLPAGGDPAFNKVRNNSREYKRVKPSNERWKFARTEYVCFVGNLRRDITELEIRDIFISRGIEPLSIRMIVSNKSKHRSYCYMDFKTSKDMETVLSWKTDNTFVDPKNERKINVDRAKPQTSDQVQKFKDWQKNKKGQKKPKFDMSNRGPHQRMRGAPNDLYPVPPKLPNGPRSRRLTHASANNRYHNMRTKRWYGPGNQCMHPAENQNHRYGEHWRGNHRAYYNMRITHKNQQSNSYNNRHRQFQPDNQYFEGGEFNNDRCFDNQQEWGHTVNENFFDDRLYNNFEDQRDYDEMMGLSEMQMDGFDNGMQDMSYFDHQFDGGNPQHHHMGNRSYEHAESLLCDPLDDSTEFDPYKYNQQLDSKKKGASPKSVVKDTTSDYGTSTNMQSSSSGTSEEKNSELLVKDDTSHDSGAVEDTLANGHVFEEQSKLAERADSSVGYRGDQKAKKINISENETGTESLLTEHIVDGGVSSEMCDSSATTPISVLSQVTEKISMLARKQKLALGNVMRKADSNKDNAALVDVNTLIDEVLTLTKSISFPSKD